MTSKTVEILSANANIKPAKSASVSWVPPTLKKEFGGIIVCGSVGFEGTYLFITKELILKSTKSPSAANQL